MCSASSAFVPTVAGDASSASVNGARRRRRAPGCHCRLICNCSKHGPVAAVDAPSVAPSDQRPASHRSGGSLCSCAPRPGAGAPRTEANPRLAAAGGAAAEDEKSRGRRTNDRAQKSGGDCNREAAGKASRPAPHAYFSYLGSNKHEVTQLSLYLSLSLSLFIYIYILAENFCPKYWVYRCTPIHLVPPLTRVSVKGSPKKGTPIQSKPKTQ